MLLGIIGWGCHMRGVFGSLTPFFVNPRAYQDTPPLAFFVSLGIILLIFLVSLGYSSSTASGERCEPSRGAISDTSSSGSLVERYLE